MHGQAPLPPVVNDHVTGAGKRLPARSVALRTVALYVVAPLRRVVGLNVDVRLAAS